MKKFLSILSVLFFATALGQTRAVNNPNLNGDLLFQTNTGSVVTTPLRLNGTLGQAQIPLGSVSQPGLGVIGDSNTGLFSPGADQLAFVANSFPGLILNSAGGSLNTNVFGGFAFNRTNAGPSALIFQQNGANQAGFGYAAIAGDVINGTSANDVTIRNHISSGGIVFGGGAGNISFARFSSSGILTAPFGIAAPIKASGTGIEPVAGELFFRNSTSFTNTTISTPALNTDNDVTSGTLSFSAGVYDCVINGSFGMNSTSTNQVMALGVASISGAGTITKLSSLPVFSPPVTGVVSISPISFSYRVVVPTSYSFKFTIASTSFKVGAPGVPTSISIFASQNDCLTIR